MTHDTDPTDPCWSKLPVYRPGGKLSAEQLTAGQDDALRRDRLLNRALHGVGVVFGYDIGVTKAGHVRVDKNRIWIGCGLALDRHGRMLYWPGGWLCYGDVIGCKPKDEGCFTLRVHYAERPDRGGWDRCHDGATWIHRCVVFTLEKGCDAHDPCPDNLPPDPCLPRRDFICARTGQWPDKAFAAEDLEHACTEPPALDESDCGRYGYDAAAGLALACVPVCDLDADKDHCPPRLGFCPCRKDEDCNDGYHKDDVKKPSADAPASTEVANPPPFLSQRAAREAAQAPAAAQVAAGHAAADLRDPSGKDDHHRPDDACGDGDTPDCRKVSSCDLRQIVYRAPVLYEIINDADDHRARVIGYSWSKWALGPWDQRMPLGEFKARTEACMTDCDGKTGDVAGLPWAQGFVVIFSRPVRADTLHPMSVMFDVWIRENEIDPECGDDTAQVVDWVRQRVPVTIVPLRVDRSGLAQAVRICPSGSWVRLRRKYVDRCANGDQHARVEITLRGQMILDACGCMLDARPPELTCRDHCETKTGQTRPGGDWVSAFRVGPDLDDRDWDKDAPGDDMKGYPDSSRTAQQPNGDLS